MGLPSVQSSHSVVSLCPLCDPMNRSTSGLPVHHQCLESTQTHVHWVGDAIKPSHPLLLLPSIFPSIMIFSNESCRSITSFGEGNDTPLQCSCLENPMDRGTWWAAISGVAQSRTWLKRLSSSSSKLVYTGILFPILNMKGFTLTIY